jgi:hypothetical protein
MRDKVCPILMSLMLLRFHASKKSVLRDAVSSHLPFRDLLRVMKDMCNLDFECSGSIGHWKFHSGRLHLFELCLHGEVWVYLHTNEVCET